MGTSSFLNISNHPSAGWSASQRDAARALDRLTEIVDWPRDELQVDPEASTQTVVQHAESIAQRVIESGVQHAMVAGEPVLAWNIVRLLSDAGVNCYAATTERDVEEEIQEDGSVRKVVRFQFVKWRRYS
jgi:hypothetical protein